MKRILLASAVLIASPAAAQQWTVGEQPIVYPLISGAPEQLGDGSNAHGGTPPAASIIADPIASNFDAAPWSFAASIPAPIAAGAAEEPKFRTICGPAKSGWYDPVLFPGQANAGHPHLFFGNDGITKDSTYASLRSSGGSSCGGGPINRSGYWMPGLMLGDSPNTNTANKMLKNDFSIAYYNGESVEKAKKSVPLAPGFAYVNGFDVNDPTSARYAAIIAANNNRPGQTANYVMPYRGAKWICEDHTVQGANAPVPNAEGQPYFRKKDGSWSMVCGTTDPTKPHLIGEVVMQECWDGKNLTSPDARKHVIPVVRETNSGKEYCPNTYYRLPKFEQTVYFSVSNEEIASGRLYLSSDRMSADPTKWFNEGQTLHQDWIGAWDRPIMNAWMSQCLGMDDVPGQPAVGTPRSCIDTNFGNGRQGVSGQPAPDGSRNPQVDTNVRQNRRGVYRYYPVVKPLGPVAGAHTHGGM